MSDMKANHFIDVKISVKNQKKKLVELEIRGRNETVKTAEQIRSTKIFIRVLGS